MTEGIFLSSDFNTVISPPGVRAAFIEFMKSNQAQLTGDAYDESKHYYCAITDTQGRSTAIYLTNFNKLAGDAHIFLGKAAYNANDGKNEIIEVYELDRKKIKSRFEDKKNTGRDDSRLNINADFALNGRPVWKSRKGEKHV